MRLAAWLGVERAASQRLQEVWSIRRPLAELPDTIPVRASRDHQTARADTREVSSDMDASVAANERKDQGHGLLRLLLHDPVTGTGDHRALHVLGYELQLGFHAGAV